LSLETYNDEKVFQTEINPLKECQEWDTEAIDSQTMAKSTKKEISRKDFENNNQNLDLMILIDPSVKQKDGKRFSIELWEA